jgi:hypothetical protein
MQPSKVEIDEEVCSNTLHSAYGRMRVEGCEQPVLIGL